MRFGKTGYKCDACGKFANNRDGEYLRKDQTAGYINSKGRNCPHDVCDECENKASDDACPVCGEKPQ